MHAASIHNSDRLKRVHDLLADGLKHTTMAIISRAQVCAVNSCIAELRANGFEIESGREGGHWWYRMKTDPTLLTGAMTGGPSGPASNAELDGVHVPQRTGPALRSR